MDSEPADDMIIEIISRSASLKTLGIMRCTSKQLNTLTYEPYFLTLYKKRNNIVSGFLLQTTRRGWEYIHKFAPSPDSHHLDLGFLKDVNARILATSEQGLLVYQYSDYSDNGRKDSYRVCKPATKQEFVLPSPCAKYRALMVAIVVMGSKPLRYKIIRFTDHPYLQVRRKWFNAYGCDLFDSETCKWRSLKRVRLPDGVMLCSYPEPVTCSGSIYMLLTNNHILKFDAHSEIYKVFPSPIPYDPECISNPSLELLKYEGRLGLICKRSVPTGCWEIWVLTTDESWEKVYVCNEKDGVDERGSVVTLYDSDTSVVSDYNTLMYCKFKQEGDSNNMINRVALCYWRCQMFPFKSDFEPVDFS